MESAAPRSLPVPFCELAVYDDSVQLRGSFPFSCNKSKTAACPTRSKEKVVTRQGLGSAGASTVPLPHACTPARGNVRRREFTAIIIDGKLRKKKTEFKRTGLADREKRGRSKGGRRRRVRLYVN